MAPSSAAAERSVHSSTQTSVHDRILGAGRRLFASKGYENASTLAIARLAGTSESQLMKHFGSKEGLLEAIFNDGWGKIIGRVRQRLSAVRSPREKLTAVSDMILTALEQDPDLKLLLLLEGRRIRRNAPMILLAPGFLEFVRLLDELLAAMRRAGQLRRELDLQAARSALMGAFEGMLRDQLLAGRVGYPARYRAAGIRRVTRAILAAFGAGESPRRRR